MKKIFLSLFTFTPLFFCLSAISVKASPADLPLEISQASSASPGNNVEPITQPTQSQGDSPENGASQPASLPTPDSPNESSDDGRDYSSFTLAPTSSYNESGDSPSNRLVENRREVESLASIPNAVAANMPTDAEQPIAPSEKLDQGGEQGSGTSTIASQPPVTPVSQRAQPVRSYSSPDRPYASNTPAPRYAEDETGLSLPGEVVLLAQQKNYEISRESIENIERAMVAEGIQLENKESSDKEKPVYKVELENISFLCGEDGETPATVAKIKGQDELIVVLWDSDFFTKAGYDPQTRCKQASARFAAFAKKDLSAYLTSGKLNNQSIICLTSSKEGDCGDGIALHDGLLFTLKPNEDADTKLEQLAEILQPKSSTSTETPKKKEEEQPTKSEKPLKE